jgi:hypothetical protein
LPKPPESTELPQSSLPMPRRTRHFLPAILLAGSACASAHAAELGEVRVASHVGQPLVADIELTLVEDGGQPVGVRLAEPEVYRGAGLALPPVLASAHFAVMRRDGRQFLHVTSLRPVDADHLHLYLELDDCGQRSVRLATLWLTPDPAPAPVLPAVPAAAPAPTPMPAPVPAPASAPAAIDHPAPVRPPRPATDHPAVHASPKPVQRPVPKTATVAPPSAEPAACVHRDEAAQVCAALGEKNAALRTDLGHLEDKVKGLQASLGAAPAPQAAPEPAGPKPIHAIKPLVPKKPPAPPPNPGLPWGWIVAAAAAVAASGAGVVLAMRRRARLRGSAVAEQGAAVASPGMFARMRAGLASRFRRSPARPDAV